MKAEREKKANEEKKSQKEEAEKEEKEKREKEERECTPPAANEPLQENNLRRWMAALANKVLQQDQKIEKLENTILQLRMTINGNGKRRSGTGKPAKEILQLTEDSPEYFPRPSPPRGPGGPAPPRPTSYAAAGTGNSRGAKPPTGPKNGTPPNRTQQPTTHDNPTNSITEEERQRRRLAQKRDDEARMKLEVILPSDMSAEEFIVESSLKTVAQVLGIPEDKIQGIRNVNGKRIIEVTCRNQETRDTAIKKGTEIAFGKWEAKIKATENWTGMVIGGIATWAAGESGEW